MMDFDASWCTVCDKLIAPKRFQVAIEPAPAPAPAPPPSSPLPSPTSRKTKPAPRKGLVNGTGRVRPNGSLKPLAPPPPSPAQPIRYRTVIDQSPQGIYCSPACELADRTSTIDGRRVAPAPAPPSPVASTSSVSSSESSSSSSDEEFKCNGPRQYTPDQIKFAKAWNFPPLPDLNRIHISTGSDDDEETFTRYGASEEYSGGIMMAARRMDAVLPKPRKQPVGKWDPKPQPHEPIPGWTDGSHAWRSQVYTNTTAPNDPSRRIAQDNFKTVTPGTMRKIKVSRRSQQYVEDTPVDPTPELFSLFSETLSRRAESRMSPSTLSTSPSSFESAPIKRERSLLSPGAEGKLLVPDVKLKVRSSSSASLSSTCTSRGSSSRRSVRSPVTPSDPEALTPLRSKRPPVETRSWSYDNVLTYPVMPHPTRIVKTKEMRLVDGKEVPVIIETEKPAQKLFLFPVQYPVTS
ncbi:hypothetical protein D9611_009420 [Ephemerocybe angulata]|uniref:Uncharacterized protein n=1 Tax=Ephemerocybe angulata TaxID=980116 RepID=A0A8H5AW15_9AGAR|nr:hypothetical protein D9611_009420 [Tulosesus angulatus]